MSKGTVNRLTLLGNLGSDPDVKVTPKGNKVANFSIATTESFNRGNGGEWEDRTEWHRLVLWDKLAERAEKFLKKGDKIFVEGSIRTRDWEDNQNKQRQTVEVRVYQMEMVGSKSTAGNSTAGANGAAQAPVAPTAVTANADDLPF